MIIWDLYLELKIPSLIFLYLFISRYNILKLPKVEYHNELHNEGDIQEGDVDGEDKLEQLHHDSHNTVRKRSIENLCQSASCEESCHCLAAKDKEIVNLRFYLHTDLLLHFYFDQLAKVMLMIPILLSCPLYF